MIQFELDDRQTEAAEVFRKEHSCRLRGKGPLGIKEEIYVGAIGGAIGYKFIPTGLGVIVIVFCACGVEENLTDFDNW